MGMGTQARQLHSLQTGLGLCVRACVCTPLVCVHVCAPPPDLFPKMPGLSGPLAPSFWAGESSQWTSQLRTG